jgi:hypothetical protein
MTAPDGGPDNRSRDGLLTDLGSEVHQLRRTSDKLHQDVREIGGIVAELPPQIQDHDSEIAALKGTLEELTAQAPQAENPPINWPELSSEEAGPQWDALASWIANVLVPYYGITRGQLPDCWPMHWRAVLELSWLRTCYRQAFVPSSPPTAAAEWHTRWLDAALSNVATAIPETWCRPGEHHVHKQQSQQGQQGQPAASSSSMSAAATQRAGSAVTPPAEGQQPPWMGGQEPQQQQVVYHQQTERDQLALPQYWEQWFGYAKQTDIARRQHVESQMGNS